MVQVLEQNLPYKIHPPSSMNVLDGVKFPTLEARVKPMKETQLEYLFFGIEKPSQLMAQWPFNEI
jgi:hypothetical protein